MEDPSNTANKQKIVDTSSNTQALQVVTAMPPTTTSVGSSPAILVQTPQLPRVELSTAFGSCSVNNLGGDSGTSAALAPARVTTPSDVEVSEEQTKRDIHVPPPADRKAAPPLPQDVPPKWLALLNVSNKVCRTCNTR
ncbi:UNVERIFIED_CONTAM: hypothetical protein Sradi_0880100 [Sesamum radiatum]|uniref:Uncharacterized protein n=1 Tax=Sesamum radiatum TaxID=300843 RepID=A0AAW2V3G4_SESRA